MKISRAAILVAGVVLTATGIAQQPALTTNRAVQPASATLLHQSPAEQRIAAARQEISADPKKAEAYNELANAYLKRARETDDAKWLSDAEAALARGFNLDSGDFSLQKTQVALMLARGEFAQAKEKATQLNRRTPDDVMVYGYLAEAQIGLRDYDAAEKNAQWMLNMLPNNIPGLMIGAKLRRVFGDPQGATEFLNLAYTETSPTEVEDLAWIANQIAEIDIDTGNAGAAVAVLEQAEQTFPQYPYTERNLARARKLAQSPKSQSKSPDSPQPEKADGTAAGSNLSEMSASTSTPEVVEANAARSGETRPADSATIFPPVPIDLLTPRPGETDRQIKRAQTAAARNPNDSNAYAVLGAAYFQRARETGDVSDYELSDQSLTKSLGIDSSDFSAASALATMAEVCMGEHRFADAIAYSQKALAIGSGDVSPFAVIGDAYADMGEYDKARDAYARLTAFDARTTYARDSRVAYLQFIAGQTGEAIRLMKAAVAEAREAAIPSENLAWLDYELGEFNAQTGDAISADAAYREALRIHPGDYRALAGLARLRANRGDYPEAILLYQKAIAVVPMPVFVAELGDLYEKSGDHVNAEKQYSLVEYIGLLGHVNQVLHNRDLALFYADHDVKLAEALELARREFEVRHDIYTWDALAWALYKNGKFVEAARASEEALTYGTRDALLLFHAGMIASRDGQKNQAERRLRAALEINPRFHPLYADQAQRELELLNPAAQSERSGVNDAR